jgi:hypothetical protein
MKKKQTSVDWLVDFFEDYFALIPLDIIEQAKAMEKQQIENAYNRGTINGIDYPESSFPLTGEEYYNKTFQP